MGPPCIYGPGRGPGNTRSMQAYEMTQWTLKNGFAPVIGTGLSESDQVHVNDLADLFVKLVEATRDDKLSADPDVFGERGYYFAENGAFQWGDLAQCEYFFFLKKKITVRLSVVR